MKLKVKLSLIVTGIMIMVVSAISFILLNNASKLQMETTIRSTERLAAEQARDIQRREELYLQTARSLAQIMGDFESLPTAERRQTYDRIIESVLEANPNYMGIWTVWKPGAIDGMDESFAGTGGNTAAGQYASWYTRATGQVEHHPWRDWEAVTAAMPAEETVSPVGVSLYNGEDARYFSVMVPVINSAGGEQTGVVGININIAGLQPYVKKIIDDPNGIVAMIVYSSDGTVLASIDPARIGRNMLEADAGFYVHTMDEAARAVREGNMLDIREYSPVLETWLRAVLYPLHIGNAEETWTVMMAVSETEVLREINQMKFFTIALAAIFMTGTAVVIFLVSGRISGPIVKMSRMLKDLSEGEGDLTLRLAVKTKDEIGDMAHYFNLTLDKIKGLVVTIRDKASSLFDIGSELTTKMTETAAAVNEITSNIQSIKGQVINQSASVTETNSTMEQVTVNIDKLNGQVENQSDSVSRSSSAIEEMLANISSVTQTLCQNAENVRQLGGAAEMGRGAVQAVSNDIETIAKESEGLVQINTVIKDIAAQTNLLSMNAAIEAAHAGEAGRGFAVVAEEIRKLAVSSSHQSKIISDVLKKMRVSIDTVINSTGTVLEKFGAIDEEVRVVSDQSTVIKTAMEEQQAGSRQILEAIGQLNDITRMVKNGSEEMLEGSREVISESSNLGRVTEEIANGMNEMAAGVTQINSAVHRVNEITIDNQDQISVLVREVERFKID
ncbi:MAG: methyl-accepting chemotaxis protein [Treponema sp.]|jgi:methyl-accepting chemotaxis protein|nr:methyl-accepting chemotaxis protein [Treponema sp.]